MKAVVSDKQSKLLNITAGVFTVAGLSVITWAACRVIREEMYDRDRRLIQNYEQNLSNEDIKRLRKERKLKEKEDRKIVAARAKEIRNLKKSGK